MSRDLVGYGANPPDARWPYGARVAVQFVINYEEGAENTILNGDAGSEAFLSDMVGAQSHKGARSMAMGGRGNRPLRMRRLPGGGPLPGVIPARQRAIAPPIHETQRPRPVLRYPHPRYPKPFATRATRGLKNPSGW